MLSMLKKWIMIGTLGVLTVAPALAQPATATDKSGIDVEVSGTLLTVSAEADFDSAALTVSGPRGYALRRRFQGGEAIRVDLSSGECQPRRPQSRVTAAEAGSQGSTPASERLPDGEYHYEVLLNGANGGSRRRSGLFFAEGGAAISRAVERAELARVRGKLGTASANLRSRAAKASISRAAPATAGSTVYDYLDILDPAKDNLTALYLQNYLTGNITLGWSVVNYYNSFQVRNAGLSEVTVLGGTRVGIGTTAPTRPLEIKGASPQERLEDGSGNYSAFGVGSLGLWIYDKNGNAIAELNHGAAAGSLVVGPSGVGVNVGVLGSPTAPLDIAGKNGTGVNTIVDGGSLVVERGDSTPNIRFLKTAGTAQSWLFQNNSTSGVFAIRDETGGTSPVQIFPGAGAQLLQLQGTHVNVNGQIWQRGGVLHADYVFDPGYKLESIAEHAKYMWKHKHLPAIAGMKRDAQGREMVNLGAQQRGIVEELEEAHIYIAQLNRRDEKLAKELAATKAELKKQRESTQAELAAQRRDEQNDLSELRREIQRLEKGSLQ